MAEHYFHTMPFGAEVLPDGQVRFQLWAPSQAAVALVVEDEQRVLPMAPLEDGFFGLTTDAARVGSRYRFQLDDGLRVPDPASRWQPDDVHGPSVVVDPRAYAWRTPRGAAGRGQKPCCTSCTSARSPTEGTFDGVRRKLDHLAELGVTAIELMPLAEFSGTRNWGYDGVMPFAPDAAYGSPDDLKRLIDEAHGRGLMMFLDVVYNHFGPDGNYLHQYAESFFEPDEHTPWGAAINYKVRAVREFAIHNVLYWLEEFRFDGLRFDAVDRIIDRGEEHILKEIAATVRRTIRRRAARPSGARERQQPGASARARRERSAGLLRCAVERRHPPRLSPPADWRGGRLLRRLRQRRARALGRALSSGFVYQGDVSDYRHGAVRGEPSAHLPPTAFVAFIQNHDQVGNRAFGERIADLATREAVQAMQAILLLAPQIPLLFMGEEWGATQPFCFFTDFHDELADAVREGRRREFSGSPNSRAQTPARTSRIPTPGRRSRPRVSTGRSRSSPSTGRGWNSCAGS